MAKTFQQSKNEAIIFCPQHGRLENQERMGSVTMGGDSHYFYMAYCPQCRCCYATYQPLLQLRETPKQNGVALRVTGPLSPQQAKRREAELQAAALQSKRQAAATAARVRQSKQEQEEWLEIFDPKAGDFGALLAQSLGEDKRIEKGIKKGRGK